MDISVYAHHNIEIKLEISHFDTVTDIKQKIQSLTGIAVPRQTLLFNSIILQDEADVARCNLFDHSCVHLLIRHPVANPLTDPSSSSSSPPHQVTQTVLVLDPITRCHIVAEMSVDSSVLILKQNIEQSQKIDLDLFTLYLFGKELDESLILGEVEGLKRDDAVVEMVLAWGVTRIGSGDTVKAVVAVGAMNAKVSVTLTMSNSFRDLRREIEKLSEDGKVQLPEMWIFMYRKEKVMIECVEFEKFKVVDGDIIQVHASVV